MNTLRSSPLGAFLRAVTVLLGWLVLAGCEPTMVGVPAGHPPHHGIYTRGGPPEVSGNANVFRDGHVMSARLPVALQPGDAVETWPGGTAVIRYPDGSEIYLDVNTRVHFSDLFLEFGRILVRVRGWFEVETETVVTGVEGTEYVLSVARDGALRVVVFDGIVACRSKRGYWLPVRLRRGEMLLSNFPNISVPLVRPANPVERDDARGWIRGIETIRPAPPPLGYCCDGGAIRRSPPEACRGIFSFSEKEAVARCEETRPGFCCQNGEVVPTTRGRCQGQFFLDRHDANDACRPAGFCCDGGKVYPATREGCERAKGAFFDDERTASRACAPKPVLGYCCDGGKVTRTTRDRCERTKGAFFDDERAASRACAPKPVQGYCCDDGKVTRTTRDRCERAKGAFFDDERAASRACAPKPVLGYCCDDGKVFEATRDRCDEVKGRYYQTPEKAKRNCKP
jgi:hypothetical protein